MSMSERVAGVLHCMPQDSHQLPAHVFADAVQGHAAPGSLALVSFDNIGSLLTILGLSLHAIRSRFSSLALGAVTP